MIRTFIGLPVLLCVAALGHAWMQECDGAHWRFFALCVTLLVASVALAVVTGASGKVPTTLNIPNTKRLSMEELRRQFTPTHPHIVQPPPPQMPKPTSGFVGTGNIKPGDVIPPKPSEGIKP